jgi:hypothetical protein
MMDLDLENKLMGWKLGCWKIVFYLMCIFAFKIIHYVMDLCVSVQQRTWFITWRILDHLFLFFLFNKESKCTHCHLYVRSFQVRRLEYRPSVHKCINHFIDVFVEQTKQIWYHLFFGGDMFRTLHYDPS